MKKLFTFFAALFLCTNLFAKTLEVKATLPISAENEMLVTLVAAEDGWTPDTFYETGKTEDGATITETVTPEKYVTDLKVKPYLTQYITSTVSQAYGSYFGKSKTAERKALEGLVLEKLVVTAEFKND